MSHPFTVIGVIEETGQIVSHHVMADSRRNAFAQLASQESAVSMIAALSGHLEEGRDVEFPDVFMMDSEFILAMPQHFGIPSGIPG